MRIVSLFSKTSIFPGKVSLWLVIFSMFLRLNHKKLDFFRIFYRSVGVVLAVPQFFV